MKTPIDQISSDIIVARSAGSEARPNAIDRAGARLTASEPRAHILARRAQRWARRANH